MQRTVLVTGGAGYLGSILVPKLVAKRDVVVLDSMWFGASGLDEVADRVRIIDGDLRDSDAVARALDGVDEVIHLAAVSNDPCSELDAELTKSVNLDATLAFMKAAEGAGVSRFLNASSASVYGIKADPDVTEDLPLEPLTLYAKYKAETEEYLTTRASDSFCVCSVRAATVCGYSPRLRLDLTINILTSHALSSGTIRVFGGEQLRPNVHIQDLTDFYIHLLERPAADINGRSFNVVRENASVLGLAEMIRDHVSSDLEITIVETEDKRSYHLSGERAARELGYKPSRPLSLAVDELSTAFRDGRVKTPSDIQYRNVEVMKRHPERTRFGAR